MDTDTNLYLDILKCEYILSNPMQYRKSKHIGVPKDEIDQERNQWVIF